jgi:SAM-dependent methyltransferase
VTAGEFRARASSFGAVAEAYERGRPPYPEVAVEWLVPAGTGRVLDLGAGTGKLTRQLVDRGLEVVAVEPSPGMRDQLRVAVPGVELLAGTGEEIPLPDAAVDVVVVAQAWHWVDAERAVPEVARVLRPGGRLGLLWNVRDERDPWTAALTAVMHRHVESDHADVEPTIAPPFGPMQRLRVRWTHRLSRTAVLDLVASRSDMATMTPSQRADVLDEVRQLTEDAPASEEGDAIAIPYVTHCSRTQLPQTAPGAARR